MGDVDAASERVGMLAGDEQRIAARDQRQPAWIESFALQRGTCDPGDGLMAARLDVLGTVAEGLLDADRETLSVPRQDPSIHAVAAAGRPFQAEDAEASASPRLAASGSSACGRLSMRRRVGSGERAKPGPQSTEALG